MKRRSCSLDRIDAENSALDTPKPRSATASARKRIHTSSISPQCQLMQLTPP